MKSLGAGASGSQTVKVLPFPEVEVISSRPSCRFRMCFTMARPRPVPPLFRLDVTLTRGELERLDRAAPKGATAGERYAAPQMQALNR